MYKVIYRKNDGKVVGCYPFEYEQKTVYIFKDIIPETSEEIKFEIPESELANYNESKVEKMITQTCNAKFFYNKETCEAIEVYEVPELAKNQYLVYQDGEFIVKTDNAPLIAELKAKLIATDYQAIKYAEGQISEEDYAPIKAQRQAWRDEINELEANAEIGIVL